MSLGWIGIAPVVLAALGCHELESVEPMAGPTAPPDQAVALPAFNREVLALIAGYPDRGFGGYAWPAPAGTAGTTRDLVLGGDTIARGGHGNHCVGVTLEVYWRALEACPGGAAAAFAGSRAARRFRRLWYVPVDGGAGPAEALPAHRLGARIARLDDALPGDFVQAWAADGSGHSMVFLGWDRDPAGAIRGIRYWSSQPWTDGIGASSMPVGPDGWVADQIHVARAACPAARD